MLVYVVIVEKKRILKPENIGSICTKRLAVPLLLPMHTSDLLCESEGGKQLAYILSIFVLTIEEKELGRE